MIIRFVKPMGSLGTAEIETQNTALHIRNGEPPLLIMSDVDAQRLLDAMHLAGFVPTEFKPASQLTPEEIANPRAVSRSPIVARTGKKKGTVK